MKLRQLFFQLARMTTPHGYESYCWGFIPHIRKVDVWRNVWVLVTKPDGTMPTTMFSCHCDNACDEVTPVKFRIEGDVIKTDGASILGADNKIGVALMIKMIYKKIPGFYLFHAGEEKGGIGSRGLAAFEENCRKTKNSSCFPIVAERAIAFDRRAQCSVITHQGSNRTCSEEFAIALCEQLDMKHLPDDGGSFTDTKSYYKLIPECTNISAGYLCEHTRSESLDMAYAEKLFERICAVDWESLPTKRNPAEIEPYVNWMDRPEYKWDNGKVVKIPKKKAETFRGCGHGYPHYGHGHGGKIHTGKDGKAKRADSVIGYTAGPETTTLAGDLVQVEGRTYRIKTDPNSNVQRVTPVDGLSVFAEGPPDCRCGEWASDRKSCMCGRTLFEANSDTLDAETVKAIHDMRRGNPRVHSSLTESPTWMKARRLSRDGFCHKCESNLIRADYTAGYCTHCATPILEISEGVPMH